MRRIWLLLALALAVALLIREVVVPEDVPAGESPAFQPSVEVQVTVTVVPSPREEVPEGAVPTPVEPAVATPVESPVAEATPAPMTLEKLVERGLKRDGSGRVVEAFGLDVTLAREVLYPVTKRRALPADYVPAGLVAPSQFGVAGAQPVRSLIGLDLAEMNRASGGALVVASGYRSYEYQKTVFEAEVARELRRGRTRAEAEVIANTQSAQPGHSEHQLGTTIDFNLIEESFANTPLGQWLAANSWKYGFVMSYTPRATERSGYVFEPWHYRWVGRPLARLLQEQNYLDSETPVNEYLEAIWRALGS